MSAKCCNHTTEDRLRDSRYRRVLWAALVINAGMFLIGIIASVAAGATPLQADALDFLADTGNYGISLFVAVAVLLANAASVALLWVYRTGDSNMRSVWLCSRNDRIGNFAVLLAALGVFKPGQSWPDIFVAFVMDAFGLQGARRIIRLALAELQPRHVH